MSKLGLYRGFCVECNCYRMISIKKPRFCLSCGSYKIKADSISDYGDNIK